MKIHGLQKMTLLDYPGHVACTVFLSGCDFRCPFCHNYDLATGKAEPVMEEEELLSFLKKRKGLLDGVAVTGGEPCLNRGLVGLLEKIQDMGFATKLDTNGYHPDRLREILSKGLVNYVAMDIKNSPGKYEMTAGFSDFSVEHRLNMDRIRESIKLLMESSVEYEFRTTVVRELHEIDDFKAMGELIKGADKYYLQPFTDRDTVPFEGFHSPSKEELKSYLLVVSDYVKRAEIRGTDS